MLEHAWQTGIMSFISHSIQESQDVGGWVQKHWGGQNHWPGTRTIWRSLTLIYSHFSLS
jgi:hypothetical protein